MPARLRRFLGMIGVLLFLAGYVWAAVWIADRLPDTFWVTLVYYVVAGTAWGVPLVPFLRWADRER
ncbi:MAG: DUF2842 domain-containing protein [Brevundimonas sp.]|nr:MAG: DUF2842 domain-containing protein [Brevundimonas sp.]